MIGASGGYLQLFGTKNKTWEFPEHDNDCKAIMLFSVPISQGASILRHSVIKNHGIRYKEDLPPVGEDWLYWLDWSKVSKFENLQDSRYALSERRPQCLIWKRQILGPQADIQTDIFILWNSIE